MRRDTPMARRARARVGATSAFVPNDTDVNDLVALLDFRIARTKAVYDAHPKEVIAKDLAWPVDWSMLNERYTAARAKVTTPALLETPRDRYWNLLRSVQAKEGTRSPGDLSDLMSRLGKAGYPVDESDAPKPASGNDPALAFLQATEHVPTPAGLFAGAEEALKWGALLFVLSKVWK